MFGKGIKKINKEILNFPGNFKVMCLRYNIYENDLNTIFQNKEKIELIPNEIKEKIKSINKKDFLLQRDLYNNKQINDWTSNLLSIKSNIITNENYPKLLLDITKQRKDTNEVCKNDLTIAKIEGFLYLFRKGDINLICLRKQKFNHYSKKSLYLLEFLINGQSKSNAKHIPLDKIKHELTEEELDTINKLSIEKWYGNNNH